MTAKYSLRFLAASLFILAIILAPSFYYVGKSMGPSSVMTVTETTTLSANQTAPTGEPIKIGIDYPFTGPSGTTGQYARRGADLAIERINAEGGILGRPVEAVYTDDESKLDVGVANIEKLITVDKVDVLVGGYHSSIALAQMDVVAKYGVPWVDPMSTADAIPAKVLANPGKYWMFFKTCPNTTQYGTMWENFIADAVSSGKFKPATLNYGIIVEDSDYGRGVASAVNKEMKALGWTSVGDEVVPLDQIDFYTILNKFKSEKVSFVLSTLTASAPTVALTKQFRETGIEAVYGFVGAKSNFIELAGNSSDRVLYAIAIAMKTSLPESKKLIDAYNAQYGPQEYSTYFTAGLQWDGMMIMRQAIERAGSLDPRKVSDELMKTDWTGTMGRYVFGLNHESKPGPDYIPGGIFQIQEGKDWQVWPFATAEKEFEVPPWIPQ
jgi:branched-chain amino acid transport system substrate-binding protein